ncbi:breast cancer type 2 susceptibility protein [Mantella aurantiaca]
MASVQLGGSVFLQLLHTHCAASDLGHVSVKWFEELSAEAVQRQSRLCVDEDKRAEVLDDSLFKTPKHKQPNYSQLDSTPIIFKEQSLCSPLFLSPARDRTKNQPVAENVRRVINPESSPGDTTQLLRDEVFGTSKQCHNNSPSMTREIFKTPLWDKKYSHRTPPRDGKNDVFDSLCCTPKFIMNTTSSRFISESLGAEADPEMSWSSSLATPPSPTVIIAQENAETSRIRHFDNKDAVIVQSLFSKLCNDAERPSTAAQTDDTIDMDIHTKADHHHTDSASAMPNEAARDTLESSESVRLQKSIVPNENACQATENVLEGMDDILSIFFTSDKPPGLRKVKVDSRAKRRKKLDSNVIAESSEDQSVFPFGTFRDLESQTKGNKSDLGNQPAVNYDPSSMQSSYEWSPLALPDLNTTQPTQADLVIYGEGNESGLSIINCSPSSNNGKSSFCHKPAGPSKVANTLEIGIPKTDQQNMPSGKPDEVIAHNPTDTEGTISTDQGLTGQQVYEKNERRPSMKRTSIKATLSIMKRQSKFLYHLNDVKNGQDERTRDISKDSHSEPFKITEQDGRFRENKEALNSENAACTHSQQDALLLAKEDSGYLKEDSLNIQAIEENILNLKDVDEPISEQAPCLEVITDLSTTTSIEEGIKIRVSRKAEDATGKKFPLESIQTCKKNTINNDIGHSDVASAIKQIQETALTSDITSDNKELLESHKGDASAATDHHNTPAGKLLPHASLCISSFENFSGFKTASNKKIHISEMNLRKGELLFKDDDPIHHNSHPLPPAADINNTLDIADSTSPFTGFRTASRKEIVISESKISKGMLLFKDIEDGKCENITKEDLLLRPAAIMVSGNEKEKELDIVEPLSKISSEETKDKRQTSSPITLDKQSSKEDRTNGMADQNILFSQHSTDSISNEKSQKNKKTSFPSEIQSRFCEILTESQKAEVSELSSILENADSQYDFTQMRKTGIVTSSSNNQNLQSAEDGISESENFNNSDVWKDVDFNDSFAAGAELVEKDSGVKLSLKRDGNAVSATACDSGVTLISEISVPKERKFGGFSLASGKCINITDEDMLKAFELFSDLDTTLLINHPSTDINKRTLLTNSSIPATLNVQKAPKDLINDPHTVTESSILNSKAESSPTFKERSATSNVCTLDIEEQNSQAKFMSEFVFGGNEVSDSAEAFCVQNINNVSCGDLASTSCLSAMPVGFSTGKGKVINVDKAALGKAKVIFNDILHPEGIYKNQGGTSSAVVEENITISQGDDSKVIHDLAVEQSAAGFITSGEGAVVPSDSVRTAKQVFENESGSELAHCMSLENTFVKKKVQFSTAQGKPIHLSEDSLKRARESFADIDNQQLETFGDNSMVNLCEVEKISTKSPSINNLQNISSIAQQDEEPVLPPLGFSTASGKSVVVSSDCLQKARIMFAEADVAIHEGLEAIESQDTHDGDQPNPAEIKLNQQKIKEREVTMKKNMAIVPPSLGFSTASGKRVAVSNESLQKARLMLTDTDNGDLVHGFQSSQTRQGISNWELCKDRSLCASENTKPDKVHLVKDNSVKPALRESPAGSHLEKPDLPSIVNRLHFPETRAVQLPQKNAPNISKPSFSTAGGKPVQMSDEALRKAREMFAGIDDGQLEGPCSFKQSVDRTERNNLKISKLQDLTSTVPAKEITLAVPTTGFSTASGKTVSVSADALHKARLLIADNGDNNTDESIGQSKMGTTNVKNCDENELFSKLGICHSKEIKSCMSPLNQDSSIHTFPEGNVPGNLSRSLVSNNVMPGMPCFSTASGKAVTLSDEALRKAQEMFSEIENDPLQQDKPEDHLGEDPLPKAHTSLQRKLKEKITLETSETSRLPDAAANTFGFSTAGGKRVSISETAMQQVKDLFEGLTDLEQLREHCPTNDKGDSDISKKANLHMPIVNKPENLTSFNDRLGDLQTCRASTVKNNKADGPSSASSADIQHPKLRCSTPFHNAGVPGKKNLVSAITSHTPENYFEIEAAESAKAFMDDEDLTDGIRATEATNKNLRNGKRLRSDDRTPHGEPPIKRQLLPEFDRSLVEESKRTLKPFKSSPHRDLKDRRKFSHNFTLKALFCDPMSFSVGKKAAQESPLTTQRPSYSRSAAFPQSSSDNSANVSGDGRQMNKRLNYGAATGTSVPPPKRALQMSSGEVTSDQTHQEPHYREDRSEHEKCAEFGSDSSQLVASLHCARDLQEMRMRKKQRQKIKPHPGSLYELKASSADRIPLVSAVQGKPPTVYTKTQLYRFGVLKNHIGINSELAKTFDFHWLDYFSESRLLSDGGVQIADGGWLVPSDKLTAGREEFYRALCDTIGVDPKLISPEWAYNHYRWIVWKLAAMEVAFPEIFASRCLTPERVLLHLKYRYEVEIDKSRRSALRRIMERDDTAAKTLILCVSKGLSWGGSDKSELTDPKQSSAVIEVTDGWYGIKALLDTALTALLHRRRLFIGQKIIVNGAELVGSEDACTPLEAPDSLMLKLAANSTRPARWFTKLGYFSDPRPFCLPLSSLFAEGGIVGCVDIVIQRIYPMQWMEKMANGTYIFRNDRAEEREAERYSSKQQKNLEALFLKIQEEFALQEACERKVKGTKRKSFSVKQIAALQDGAEIYEALQNEPDPGYLESCMSSDQLCALNHHRQSLNDKKQALIQTEFRKAIESAEQGSGGCMKREVTPVWKMRIVDYKEQDPTSAYILNIWRPLPDVVSLLKEGCRFKIYQLAASQSKCKADTAAVQLTATKKTQFQQLQPSQEILEQIYTERQVTTFPQLLESNLTIENSEVDIVGLVISTHQKIGAAPLVYLCDEGQDIVVVKFWADLSQLSLEELAKPATFIAASNLRWRSEYTAGIPIVFAGDLSYVAASPKEQHLQKAIHKLRQSVQAIHKFRQEAEIKLLNILRVPHSEERRAQHTADSHTATNKFSTPLSKPGRAQMNPMSSPTRSNLMISSASDMDPKTCKKMRGLDFLSRIPSPPPLSAVRPLVSPSLQRGFRAPRSMQKDGQTHGPPRLISKGEFVADEELAMINTQALVSGLEEGKIQKEKISPDQCEGKPESSISSSHIDIDPVTKREDTGVTSRGKLRKRRRHRL